MLARSSSRCFSGLARYQSGHRHVASAFLRSIDPVSGICNRYFSASCRQAAAESREASDTHRAPSQRLGPKSNQTENTSTVPITLTQFETLAKHGAATIEHARRCLEHLKAQLMPLPLEERRKAAAKTDAGRKFLIWLWTKHGTDPASFLHTGQARNGVDLCWFLLAQDLEEYLWKWIECEIPAAADLASFPDFDSEERRVSWIAPLLADLVRAHYEWAEFARFDAALKAFKRARELFNVYGERGHSFVQISSWALTKITQNEDDIICNASLYDTLVDFHYQVKSSHPRSDLWQLELGALALHHPTNADPKALVKWFRGYNAKGMQFVAPKIRNSNARLMLMAAYVLRHQLRADEATKLECFVEKEGPQTWWNRRTILEKLDARRSFRNVRRHDVTIPWCD